MKIKYRMVVHIRDYLTQGNLRFQQNRFQEHPKLSKPQNNVNLPICAVVGCSDSRTCAEHIFSQSLGNFFSVRNAGHIMTFEVVASLEFAFNAGITNIMLYGHTQCGAISSAVLQPPSLPEKLQKFLEQFQPLIHKIKAKTQLTGIDLINACIEENVHQSAQDLLDQSPYLKDAFEKKHLTLLKGIYVLETGMVKFLP